MTADALAALEALVANMTAGPWDARGHAIYSPCTPTGRVGMNCGVLADVIREGGQVAVVGTNPKTRPHGEDDAAGIVALRNAAVELIALARDAEALRSEFSSLRDDRDAAMERAEKAERDAEGARKQVEMMEPIYKSWDALAADHAEKSIALHHATQDLAAARALLENARECERRGMRFDRTINAAGETLAARIDSHLSAHPARDAQPAPSGEVVEALDLFIKDFSDLIAESRGVDGLHKNGDIATWDELREGGRFDSWLGSFDALLKARSTLRGGAR